jgi:hypothetical protein
MKSASNPEPPPPGATQLIEVKVQTVHQLFNSMDPSPFRERDLDRDAEHFIVGWAQEHAIRTPLRLVVHLGQPADRGDIAESIRHYFSYRAEMNLREFNQLLREGWMSLLIGLAFLAVCVTVAQTLTPFMGRWNPVSNTNLTVGMPESAANANGVASISPGLRAPRYPGCSGKWGKP